MYEKEKKINNSNINININNRADRSLYRTHLQKKTAASIQSVYSD